LAVIGNQTSSASAFMAGLPVERTATSDEWGVSKPDPAFFARMEDELGASAERIAYVGDRVDNDVLPARRAGMVAVHLRRGPWGIIHSGWPEAAEAHIRLDSLSRLEGALMALRG
jgi:FMN phosphatase YigB (HAD superfamily)